MLLLGVSCISSAQTSGWLHPLGTFEGTRSNPAKTDSQETGDILIKWRNDALKNAPVLLVGAIRTEEGSSEQQVVGIEEGEKSIIIFKANGFIDTTFSIPPKDSALSVVLTGLFDTNASSVSIPPEENRSSKPNLIGLGLEQEQTTYSFFSNGLLVNRYGEVGFRLGIVGGVDERPLVARCPHPSNILKILPVAVWKSDFLGVVAFSIVTQDSFSHNDSCIMINSVRRYRLDRLKAAALGDPVYLAPKLYPFPPVLSREEGKNFLALSTARYDFSPRIIRRQGTLQTASDISYGPSFDISLPGSSPDFPRLIAHDSSSTASSATSQFAKLNQNRKLVRIFAEQGKGHPKISLGDMSSGETIATFVDEANDDAHGWQIVIADLDTEAEPVSNPKLLINPGPEIIATAVPDGSKEETWVYLLRWNTSAEKPNSQTSDLHYFARQRIRGKIVAAGDLVKDFEHRKEVILINKDTLSILQLKPYTEEKDTLENNLPFNTLKSFSLESDIVSVAIADLEGDGENDIIVSTTEATYAIGKLQPDPFPFSQWSINGKVCINDPISVVWDRNTRGSGSGVGVRIEGDGGRFRIAQNQIRNDTMHIPADTLYTLGIEEPGRYQVVVFDSLYPWIRQLSDTFTIAFPALGQINFDLPGGTALSPGDILRDTILFCCINSGDLTFEQRRSSNANWEQIPAPRSFGDSLAIISTTVPCPELSTWGELANGAQLLYRLRTLSADRDTTVSNPITVNLPLAGNIIVERTDSGRERLRSVFWNNGDFLCGNLEIAIGDKNWNNLQPLGTVATSAGRFDFKVPLRFIDTVRLCIRCADESECAFGSASFKINRVGESFVAPNPFDPDGPDISGQGAAITYTLQKPGRVTITIYDGARTIVRQVVDSEERRIGQNRDFWDGRNSRGDIVANGTYICVISSDSGEQIVLPIAIVKR